MYTFWAENRVNCEFYNLRVFMVSTRTSLNFGFWFEVLLSSPNRAERSLFPLRTFARGIDQVLKNPGVSPSSPPNCLPQRPPRDVLFDLECLFCSAVAACCSQ